jgi:hypothetical protein
MASTTKATGSGHLMWPEGMNVESIHNDLFVVIEHALRVLSWQENLTSDECPPSWMWHLDWEIETWFKKIQSERDSKYGGNKNKTIDEDDGGMWEENVYFERMKESL